jgi:hypothetical protein
MIHIRNRWMIGLLVLIVFISGAGCSNRNESEKLPSEIPDETQNNRENQDSNNEQSVSEPVDAHHYVLYLKHRDQAYIFSDTYSVQNNDPALAEKSLAEYVIGQLIRQPGVVNLLTPFTRKQTLVVGTGWPESNRKSLRGICGWNDWYI